MEENGSTFGMSISLNKLDGGSMYIYTGIYMVACHVLVSTQLLLVLFESHDA